MPHQKGKLSRSKKGQFRAVVIQLGGAKLCIEEALSELGRIKGGRDLLINFFLNMIHAQLKGYEEQLRED
jgi:hypothetical protein